MTEDENWLDNRDITCATCGQSLGWVWHSPFHDSTSYYCTRCPTRVEVGLYDPQRKLIKNSLPREGINKNRDAYHAAIEAKLAPCDCGGSFQFKAPQRCLHCHTVLTQAEVGRDLWWAEPDKPMGTFLRTVDYWRKPVVDDK